jgi:hypothetical protein
LEPPSKVLRVNRLFPWNAGGGRPTAALYSIYILYKYIK